MSTKRPIGRNNLDRALHRLFPNDANYVEMRSMMVNVLVGQFLPDGVVKGGSSLKLRYGNEETRVTTDFDAAAKDSRDEFIEEFQARLSLGWEGFSFQVIAKEPARPRLVEPAYVMRPFAIKVNYMGKPWCTVDLELSHNEIGDADEAEWFCSSEVNSIFAKLGFPEPGKLPLMPLKYQIAQKIHGVSAPESERAHDLVDLQLMFLKSEIDLHAVKDICCRIFAYRNMHLWPPRVVKGQEWDSLYGNAAENLPVLATCDEAVAWVNDLISKIANS